MQKLKNVQGMSARRCRVSFAAWFSARFEGKRKRQRVGGATTAAADDPIDRNLRGALLR